MDGEEVAAILAAYDIGDVYEAAPMDIDPRRPWRIRAGKGLFTLRALQLYGSPEDASFEHRLANWLTQNGFPVARPIPARTGRTWIVRGGALFAIYDHVEGRSYGEPNVARARSAGACLGRFHQIASAFEGADHKGPPPGYRTLARDMGVVQSAWPARQEVRWILGGVRACEQAVAPNEVPQALCHNDFTPGNVRFRADDEIAGVYDNDCVFWGPRLADVAAAILAFGRQDIDEDDDAWRFDLHCGKAFLEGYESIVALTGKERARAPDALRLAIRRSELYDLTEYAGSGGVWRPSDWGSARRRIEQVDSVAGSVFAMT
jgi:homoserine kinase type II